MATHQRRNSFVLGFLTAVVVLAVTLGGVAAYQVATGSWRIWDEWQCSDGEAPAGVDGIYNSCRPLDQALPAGESWDPLGNRPLECDDRRRWVKVERTTAQDGVEVDCASANAPLPQGWTPR